MNVISNGILFVSFAFLLLPGCTWEGIYFLDFNFKFIFAVGAGKEYIITDFTPSNKGNFGAFARAFCSNLPMKRLA